MGQVLRLRRMRLPPSVTFPVRGKPGSQTGAAMKEHFKEAGFGRLAVNLPEC